jgi:hypothetical protein
MKPIRKEFSMLQITSLRFGLAGPGETALGQVEFTSPANASYTARITTDSNSIFKVTQVSAVHPTFEVVAGGDSADGIKHPKPTRGLVDEPAGSTDGVTPLSVQRGDKLSITIHMVCPDNPDDAYSATLTITSSNGADTTTVPLSVPTGKVDVQVLNSTASAAPGATATWSVQVRSIAGAGANISFAPELPASTPALPIPPGFVTIPPVTAFLPRRGTITLTLTATVPDFTPPGSYGFFVAETIFNGASTSTPFSLTLMVSNAPVLVTSNQPGTFNMLPGGQVQFALNVQLQGAGTAFDLAINPTPPGLTCVFLDAQGNPVPKWHLDMTTKEQIQFSVRVSLAANVAAPSVAQPLVFSWSAYGGTEQGTLAFGINPVPPLITLQQDVVTGGLSGLGGYVNLVLHLDGSYTVHFHMWNSSKVTGYDYAVRAIFSTPSGAMFVAQHSGHVGAASLLGASSEDDYTESGMHPWIQINWADTIHGRMAASHEYSASGGVVGELENLAKDVVGIIGLGVVGGVAGAALGLTIALTKETARVFSGVGETIAVIGGVVAFAIAIADAAPGTAIMFATVVGVAVGAVTDQMVQKRQITQAEYDFANSGGVGGSNYPTPDHKGDPNNASVFMGILPPIGKLWITNLCNPDRERAFTAPGVDGKIYLNMGGAFNHLLDPGGTPGTANAYPAKGQVLIHELVHAVQVDRRNVLGVVCSGIYNGVAYVLGDDVYKFGPAGPDWHSSYFNLESQAAVVDHWFAGEDKDNKLDLNPMDLHSPYFRYIDQVRHGDI